MDDLRETIQSQYELISWDNCKERVLKAGTYTTFFKRLYNREVDSIFENNDIEYLVDFLEQFGSFLYASGQSIYLCRKWFELVALAANKIQDNIRYCQYAVISGRWDLVKEAKKNIETYSDYEEKLFMYLIDEEQINDYSKLLDQDSDNLWSRIFHDLSELNFLNVEKSLNELIKSFHLGYDVDYEFAPGEYPVFNPSLVAIICTLIHQEKISNSFYNQNFSNESLNLGLVVSQNL
ncbi:hypothetical protein [Aquimarina longa]|uniref:hypothetical protein n=1 Tax=Aquimarina longa TaxID=1080221 RepID=UPI0007852FCA|nr:hypothetical protein [Aquimarina longa]